MKNIISGFVAVVMTIATSQAQVKISDNAATFNDVDTNSILELESVTKGFLPPRLALNSLSSAAPLSGSITTSMLVYSLGGAVPDGYYYWDGTAWLPFGSLTATRDNYVLVKSVADLPAPVAGVITLGAGILYEVNGTITLADKISLNRCTLFGRDAPNDKLIYTGTAELFTGANGGNIRMLTITAPAGKVFNINAGGSATANLIVRDCFIAGSSSVGTVQGFGGYVYFGVVAFIANTNGITYQACNYVSINGVDWNSSNTNTYETFTGAFNAIQVHRGLRYVNSGNTGLRISGITSITSGSIKTALFFGTGTLVSGVFTNGWEVESIGLNTEKDDVAGGNVYIKTPALTNIVTVNVPVKIAGTTTSTGLFRVTSPSNNRLTYTGAKTEEFQVICSVTATALSNNKSFSVHIFKNGIRLPQSTQSLKLPSGVAAGSITLSCIVNLVPNDYVEVWVENNSDNTDITFENLNLSIH